MRATFTLAIVCLMAPVSVSATPDKKQPAAIARDAMQDFGRCVVERTPQSAAKVLAMDFRTKAYRRALQGLASDRSVCLADGRLRMGGPLFAGALAEALLKASVTGSDLGGRLSFNPARSVIPARDDVEAMALCTAMRSPVEVAALLSTAPTSAEERTALQALAPTLQTCLRTGAKLEVNRPGLRAILALAAYRIVMTPSGTAVATGNMK